jgi:hypothetical protein
MKESEREQIGRWSSTVDGYGTLIQDEHPYLFILRNVRIVENLSQTKN